jgi:hypothetical protein
LKGVALIGDVVGISTAVAVFIAAAGVFAQSRARKFGLAQVYIKRYWKIDDHLLQEGCPSPDSANAGRYLRLCEDEFDAARQGWIDVAVWRAWHGSIQSQVRELGLNDVRKYKQLQRCMDQPDHKATKCEGLGKVLWRQKIWWWLESPLGS